MAGGQPVSDLSVWVGSGYVRVRGESMDMSIEGSVGDESAHMDVEFRVGEESGNKSVDERAKKRV